MPGSHRVAVYVALQRDGHVLMLLRQGTGYRDGEYGLPSGKVEPGETLVGAAMREAAEEIGLRLEPDDVSLRHAMERLTSSGNWLDYFFACARWAGEPVNAEPGKCAQLAWLTPDHQAVSDYVGLALAHMATGVPFSVYRGE